MAQSGYTPVSLYYSTTASAVPVNTNLVAGELALNTLDEKLYFKNSAGTVKLLASNAGASGSVTSVAASVPAFLSIAGSPITTSGTLAITYSGTALPVANGGTGLTSGTSGGVLYYSATGTLASSAALAASALVIGGGAGAAPATTTTGTGVVTALGVNTGSAGAFVVNGGALGTPSSGTVTNLTGTASININGTVGATTATTGAFTTLSASSTVSGTGFSTYLASPPAIGTTSAAAGNFTNSQITSLGVGTAASGTTGEIRATNNITAYYSDDRLKKRLGSVENALDKVRTLDSFYYEANETAQELGYEPIREVGISAQQVQAVLPEVVVPAPIDDRYLTVRYERLVPLLIAAIKELEAKVKVLEAK